MEKQTFAARLVPKGRFLPVLCSVIVTLPFVKGWSQTNGGFSVNIHDREAVRSFYDTVYLSSENIPMDSSASLVSCNAGTNSYAFRDATVRRINYYRAMAGIWASVTEDRSSPTFTKFQEAAYMCSRNSELNHTPPMSWTCYTSAGASGCLEANLGFGNGPEAIDLYIRDFNVSNAGHRRWLLNPPMGVTAVGDAPPSLGLPVNATYIFGTTNVILTNRDGFVSWPPPGFVPSRLVSSFWSFSVSNADYSQATVTVTSNSVSVPVQLQPFQSGFGQDTIVWTNPVPTGPLTGDVPYTVTISNLIVNLVATNVSYSVTLINPSNAPPSPPSVATLAATGITNDPATGTSQAALNGTVNPQGAFTGARFEFGLTTNYGAVTPWMVVGNGTNAVPVTATAGGLASGLACNFRLVATNNAGAGTGADLSFNTTAFFKAGDANGDGIVSQSELDAVLTNYWPNSPWLSLTNVAGLGGTNVTFALTNSTAGAFGVEYSTNLSNWIFLGPATPQYLFTDTNAPALPQRFYRLRWP